MKIENETVRRVAKLARLDLPEEKVAPMAAELTSILDWIEQLNEVDVEGVEAMSSTVDVTMQAREDRLTQDETGGGRPDDIVANAPKTEDHFFVVPKVVE